MIFQLPFLLLPYHVTFTIKVLTCYKLQHLPLMWLMIQKSFLLISKLIHLLFLLPHHIPLSYLPFILSHKVQKDIIVKSKRRRAKKKTKSSPIKPTKNALQISDLQLFQVQASNLTLITKLKDLIYENTNIFQKDFLDAIMKEISHFESSVGTYDMQVSQASNQSIKFLISKVELMISQWHINQSINPQGGSTKGTSRVQYHL